MQPENEFMATGAAARGGLGGPKVPFAQLCTAYLLLQYNYKPQLVAAALGVTPLSIYRLANCRAGRDERLYGPDSPRGERRGRRPGENSRRRYQKIAEEFDRLGLEAFRQAYWDEDLTRRVNALSLAPTPKRPVGKPNPNADAFAGEHALGDYRIKIRWWREAWFYRIEDEDPDAVRGPYRTSDAAYAAARRDLDLPEPA